jgi:hypothetical protein
VTIDKSVEVIGAGQRATVLKGGGPVVTVGSFGAEREPTVSIRDLTITGGQTTSSSESLPFSGQEGVLATGGGIDIPPGAPIDEAGNLGPGATLTLTRTSITDNRVAPSSTAPFGPPCPGDEPCPFALAAGGGINSWGVLTIVDSTISGNRVGSASGLSTLASDADGGAVFSVLGSVTITRSRITDNRASATGPNGRFAEGGAVFAEGDGFMMRDSVVSGNSSSLASALPKDVEQVANSGGIHITSAVQVAGIDRSIITRNSVRATNTVGDATAFVGGVEVDSFVDFAMNDSVVSNNDASAATSGRSAGLAHADTGGGQLVGTMERTRVRGNSVRAESGGGDSEAFAGGLWAQFGDVRDSELSDNQLIATSATGSATVRGGGALVDSDPEADKGGLTLTGTVVRGNSAEAIGPNTIGQGGGIFDARVSDNGPFGGPLALISSSITHNVLRGRARGTLQGGGLYLADQPLTQTDSVFAHNKPDQCFGCTASSSAAPSRRSAAPRESRSGDDAVAHLSRR